jgi:hypothetical protein
MNPSLIEFLESIIYIPYFEATSAGVNFVLHFFKISFKSEDEFDLFKPTL